jgi:hypothetical protein
MALTASGQISFSDINVELGRTSTQVISFSESVVYTLAGTGVGAQISLSTFYGKSSSYVFNQTIASNTTNYNLKSAAIAAGWDQVKPLIATVTINSAVFVYSTSTGSYAFSTGATFPAGTTLALINNGTILGKGGAGGAGSVATGAGSTGAGGGPAFIAQNAISVTNNGTIGGGGGGGGGGGYSRGT